MRSTMTFVSTMLLCVIALGVVGCQQDSSITNVDQSAKVVSTGGGQPADEKTGLVGGLIGVLDKLLGEVTRLVLPGEGAILSVRTTSFEIPAGAITTKKVISYSLWDATPQPGLTNAAKRLFKFGPEGTTFNKLCTMIVPFSELNLGNIDPRTIICYYYNEGTRHYEAQPTTVDLQNQRFIVKISHFSQYAFGRLE